MGDNSVAVEGAAREKAGAPGTVGSPMPGVVVGVVVKPGDEIKEGETVCTLSAMKMETSVPATMSGVVKRVTVNYIKNGGQTTWDTTMYLGTFAFYLLLMSPK